MAIPGRENVNHTNPAVDFAAATPSDTVDFTRRPRGLWVAVAGTVALVNDAGDIVAHGTLQPGTLIPCAGARRVQATGTTATLVAYY